jgi:hypothetical protein
MLKYRIEGFSKESMEDAVGDAMAKAAAFASEGHDLHVAILEMTVLPGRGYKAVVEVTIIPITLRETLHREAADVELKRINEQDYAARKKFGEKHLQEQIASHFLSVFGTSPDIPNFYLANLTESQIKNFFIEKNLYKMFPENTQWNLITDMTVLRALQPALDSQEHHHMPYEGFTDHELTIDNPELEQKVEHEFDHAVHPEHAMPHRETGPKTSAAPRAAPKGRAVTPAPGEDDEF